MLGRLVVWAEDWKVAASEGKPMQSRQPILPRILGIALMTTAIVLSPSFAGSQSAAPARVAAPARSVESIGAVPTEKDLSATQEQLIKLLRLSPTLTTVVARDPSLLANQEYVAHNNPQLALFLESHPEIARNPEFYLFTKLNEDGGPDQALERAVWPQFSEGRRTPSQWENFSNNLTPFLVFLCVLAATIWLTRLFVESRRWSRVFKLQSEVHGRLIEKFGSNQDLLVYMDTEAGKRFLEAAPIPIHAEEGQSLPNVIARILTPLQIGIVLSLLGAGFLGLRHASADMEIPMLVIGTVLLMPGVGFIISAGVTWLLAGRLGLMPADVARAARSEAARSELDLHSRDRQ